MYVKKIDSKNNRVVVAEKEDINSREVFVKDINYLTDINDNLEKWEFPDTGVVIDPGEFLIIWCDEDQEQGSLHTNFKLSSGGEYLALVLADGQTILDSITFPVQEQDVSYGRSDDDQDQWIYMTPSPGASNSGLIVQNDPVPANAFRINRLYPNPFNYFTSRLPN